MKSRWIFAIILVSLAMNACQAGVVPPEQVGIAAPELIQASLASVDAQDSLPLFEYDRSFPLDIIEDERWQQDGQTWIDFSYASPMGGRVPARLVIPAGQGPFPAIMLQHGSMGHIEDMESTAQVFASFGAIIIMIEDPYSRPGGWRSSEYMGATWPYYTAQDLDVKIQTIIDMRRAIDLLIARPDVDSERLAYYGVSYGATMGGLLSGVEDRLAAYVLQVGDGGLVEHTSNPGPDGLPIHFSSGWAELMWPTEPLHFIGLSSAPILFMNGLQDVNVPPADALRFQAAASEPKTVYWYDADHALTPQAVLDAAEWLEPYLGRQLLWLEPSYRAGALILDAAVSLWMLSIIISLVILWRWSTKNAVPIGQRVLSALAVLFLGPLGLAAYGLVQLANKDKQRSVLGATIFDVSALTAGLLLGNLINGALNPIQPGLALLMMYLVFLFGSWLLHRLVRGANPATWLAHILTANIYWAAAVLASAWVNEWLQIQTLVDGRLLWSLGITFLLGVIVTLPLHAWLLHRGLEQWMPEGAEDIGKPAFARIHWGAHLGLSLSSYVLVIGSLVWLIVYSTGLSLSEIARALQGG
ncbi:MAG: prolyl oligopeptidase family serine peptidase [Anaerolineales bacterium]|jgi:dienelactone hydrolase